jgi:cytochrome c556
MIAKKACAWLMATGAVTATTVAVLGHGGATGIVGERMMGMMMLSEQVKVLTPAFANGETLDPQVLREAAGMIKMHAGPAMTNLFPEGSTESPSEVRPDIWTRWDEFAGLADRLAALAAELEAAVVPQAQIVAAAPPPQPTPKVDEWEAMDFASLMGLPSQHSGHQQEVEQIVVGSIGENGAPQRAAQEVFADITATCSSCHAAFRR